MRISDWSSDVCSSDLEAPLVLLSEHEGIALEVAGSGNLSVDTASGEPGHIVIDSDGQGCDGSKKVVLRLAGKGAISADEIAMWALAGPQDRKSKRLNSSYSCVSCIPSSVDIKHTTSNITTN